MTRADTYRLAAYRDKLLEKKRVAERRVDACEADVTAAREHLQDVLRSLGRVNAELKRRRAD